MKMAIVHDGFLHVGGAEKVLLELVNIYPQADLFIPIINLQQLKLLKAKTQGKIHTTFLSHIPFFYIHASWLKPLLIFYWENLKLDPYQFVISSSHSFNAKLINVPKGVPHLSYVYTPPRYLSNHFSEIALVKNKLVSTLASPLIGWLKKKDQESGQKPSLMVAISKTVKTRISQSYQRQSVVIYPPVDTNKTIRTIKKPTTYMCFSRLVKQKGIDLAVKTFTRLNKPLTVVGTGPEIEKLKKIAGPTITFTGFVDDKKLENIFNHTKAMVNCALEEDFGMVTVEAAARGIPIIAYHSGGLQETVVENQTGVFFNQHTVESLGMAIERFEKKSFSAQKCHQYAQRFSTNIFRTKIKLTVNYLINHG